MRAELATLLLRTVNALLAAEGQPYRVHGDIISTRRDGYTIIALRETRAAADWRACAPPVNNMEARP